ncbi:Hypothetical predicted protein [Prunus dulcis]|uniref:Uncharacterized protein n=1 Tax=Prunus dulcis TaxID=3755 RepID=A0A5E4FE20_PRUDU|nr:hypothetical protein L3X38_005365 [Prunus dulcis]VVA26107.1 Hypothetical predicted protein [Prunus dulcis]
MGSGAYRGDELKKRKLKTVTLFFGGLVLLHTARTNKDNEEKGQPAGCGETPRKINKAIRLGQTWRRHHSGHSLEEGGSDEGIALRREAAETEQTKCSKSMKLAVSIQECEQLRFNTFIFFASSTKFLPGSLLACL